VSTIAELETEGSFGGNFQSVYPTLTHRWCSRSYARTFFLSILVELNDVIQVWLPFECNTPILDES
jgi:hypothetical protein